MMIMFFHRHDDDDDDDNDVCLSMTMMTIASLVIILYELIINEFKLRLRSCLADC